MAEEQLVLFSLGREAYAVSITQVKEIIQDKEVTKLPNTPEYMKGIISLRGKVIPVIELASRLGVSAKKEADRRVLIVETTGQDIGLVVDEVTEVIRLQDSAIEPPPGVTASNEYIRGIGKDGDNLLILLDVDKLFSEGDMQELKKVG